MVASSKHPWANVLPGGKLKQREQIPADRSKSGSKRHLLPDGKGVPLAVVLSGANRHEMKKLADLLDAKVVEAPSPEAVEQHLCLDRGYDDDDCRQAAVQRG